MTADIWDVLIVGAGLSGLSAAHLLLKKNPKLRILILEGKDRVGGRTVSYEIPAADGADRWDFGGQWVGRTQRHVLELIKELGLEVYPQFNDGKKVLHVGGPASKVRAYKTSIPALSPLVLLDMSQLLWKVRQLTVCVQDPSKTPNAEELDSMTLHTFIEQNAWTAELKEQIGVSSRSVFGIEPAQMSFLFFLMYAAAAGGLLALLESTPGCAQELKIKGGSQQLSECLAERVGWKNVRLGSAVTAIWQDAEWAKVMTSSDTFLCKAVIITCPPHLAGQCASRQGGVQYLTHGHIDSWAFWKEKGFSGEIVAGSSTDCPFCVTFDATSPRGNAALVGFIAGQQASHWSTKEAEQRKTAVISSLVRYLGPEAASFIHYEEKDWAKEEYSGGCPVNVMAPGLLTYYHPSLRTPCGRIFWAGTETATQWCGYMSGAVQAGQRAALEVLTELWHVDLTAEEIEALQHSVKSSTNQVPTSKLSFLFSGKSAVIAALTISGP
uniref:Amine oxidase n=1 Tax=Oryzias sinensis TaxID=183150 RepID=A0A8C7XM78_9TELE